MTKFTKIFYAAVFCFALSLCGAIAACSPKETTVTLEGEVVFEHGSNISYDTAITLSYSSEDGERSQIPVTLSFENAEGEKVTKEGFTLSFEKNVLTDESGKSYALERTEQEGKTFVTIHGEYVVTRTVDDYEAHEEGKRHYFEDGYFGLGALDLSGFIRYYHFEDMESCESDYLCFDVAGVYDYQMDGGEHFFVDCALNDGSTYIIRYDIPNVNGEDKMLVTSIEFYPPDAESEDFSLFFTDALRIKYGVLKYSQDPSEIGKELFYMFEIGYWTWPDGTVHDRPTTCYKREYMTENELLYYFDIGGGATAVLAFTMKDGRPDLETVRYGWRRVLRTEDSRYGADVYYYAPAENVFVLEHLFALGGFSEETIVDPLDVTKTEKLDDTTVAAVTADGRWVVGLGLQTEEDGEYMRVTMEKSDANAAVNYANGFNWAYKETDAEGKEADVFFVAPSAVTGKAGQEILDYTRSSARKNFVGAIDMEKGIYDDNARFFAPFYRQAVLYTYSSAVGAEEREGYLAYAYADVKNAFEYYLEHWNEGRPIVLAGFSQGADHCLRLMKEFYQSTLKDRLVACYAIGWSITQEELDGAGLKFAAGEKDTGVIVSYNCEAPEVESSLMVPAGEKSLCINPLNWKTDSTVADKSLNKGACFYNPYGSFIEEKKELTGAYIDETRGVLKAPDVSPEEYNNTLGVFEEGIYHYYDYQFFYRNLEENVQARIAAFTA